MAAALFGDSELFGFFCCLGYYLTYKIMQVWGWFLRVFLMMDTGEKKMSRCREDSHVGSL